MKKEAIILLPLFILSVVLTNQNSASAASDMAKAQKGKILLQVESNGEAWYVNPSDEMRYYMGRPEDAFGLMRQLGVGITNANLAKIKVATQNMEGEDSDQDGLSDMFEDAIGTNKNNKDTDNDSYDDYNEFIGGYNPTGSGNISGIDNNFANSQKGKIFIQVEQNGEAWYINPNDGLRYFMGRPQDAFGLMRGLGLGISNQNLEKIGVKSGYENTIRNQNSNGNNNSGNIITDTEENDIFDSSLDIELASIISNHQEKLKEFTDSYNLYEKSIYDQLVNDLFVSSSVKTAQKLDDEFFIEFVEYTLKEINKIDLNDEYLFAIEDETAILPYEKINESTIIIGLGIDFIMPYELKKENNAWKIDLSIAKSYNSEIVTIENKEETAENSEVEVYLMQKTQIALQEYKKSYGKYPQNLTQATVKYSVLKDYADDFYYAYQNNQQKCHLGIEVDEETKKLSGDTDYDSVEADFSEGFDGEDPVYDLLLE